MGYVESNTINNAVDHIQKIVSDDINDKIKMLKAALSIAFFNSPDCVENLVKISFENEIVYNVENYNLTSLAFKIANNSYTITTDYRNKNIYTILHPWINRRLIYNFREVISILLSKMFDSEDNWFNRNKSETLLSAN